MSQSTRVPADVLAEFFAYLADHGVVYGVVGDDRDLAEVHSDIDLVVDRHDLARIQNLVRSFARHGDVALVQDIQHEAVARYFVYTWRGSDGQQFLPIDICSDWLRGGRRLLTARWLLADRERAQATLADGTTFTYWRPRPAANFAYYLLKKVDKGVIAHDHGDFLSAEWMRDPSGCRVVLQRFFAADSLRVIADAAASGDWNAMITQCPRLRRELRHSPRVGPRSWLGELVRGLRRILHPTGLLVCVDGSNDFPAAAARIANDWAKAFRTVCVLDDARPLGLTRYLAEIRPQLVRSTLVIIRSAPAHALPGHSVVTTSGDTLLPQHVTSALCRRAGAARIGRFLPWATGG